MIIRSACSISRVCTVNTMAATETELKDLIATSTLETDYGGTNGKGH